MHFFWINKYFRKGVFDDLISRTSPLICPKNPLIQRFDSCNAKQTQPPEQIRKTDWRGSFSSKRNVSSFPSAQGSITAETAIALPLFLFFCVQIISVISLFQLHSAIQAAMHEETAKLAAQAYAYDRLETQEAVSLAEDVYLKGKVVERAGKEYLDRSMISGGSGGIRLSYAGTSGGQKLVDVGLSYRVEPIIRILGFSGFAMKNRCCMKAWTGYALTGNGSGQGADEEIVYITETGSVYHKSRGCTHLTLSIRAVDLDSVSGLRSAGGANYYPCEKCGKSAGDTVFITNQGNRYHASLACSGMKRTVYTVLISEAGGRGPCSRCSATG